jgi:hypothetical protein
MSLVFANRNAKIPWLRAAGSKCGPSRVLVSVTMLLRDVEHCHFRAFTLCFWLYVIHRLRYSFSLP